MQDVARDNGALLIADEMITGFARTGRRFGSEHSGIQPDIMTLGKGMGGGYPVTAVATSAEIASAEPWSKPSFSSSSYGGNPLAAAAVASSLGIIRDEALVERAGRVGSQLKVGLSSLAERHPSMANVRGEGLFLGFDLLEPATTRAVDQRRMPQAIRRHAAPRSRDHGLRPARAHQPAPDPERGRGGRSAGGAR